MKGGAVAADGRIEPGDMLLQVRDQFHCSDQRVQQILLKLVHRLLLHRVMLHMICIIIFLVYKFYGNYKSLGKWCRFSGAWYGTM